jgi:hypothetical protein
MRQPLDRSLWHIFTTCRDYYVTNPGDRAKLRRNQTYKLVQKTLTSTLRAMAELHALTYPGCIVDKRHPGYLIKFEPPMYFRVPYHVLPAFPTGDEFEALWQLSRTIRSGDRTVIAISGSNVLRKVFDIVGDVDFCEYFPAHDIDGFDKMASNLDGTERIACLRLSLADKKWAYPWGEDKPTKEFFKKMINSSDEYRSSMKVDYVGDIDHLGVTEITNVIIAIDENGESASLGKTFAAQEAPIGPIDQLPNQMNDPIEMGRYINWLSISIADLRQKGDMRKCLKRCASLSRVLFVPDITEDIADLAGRSPILLSHKMRELKKLLTILEPLLDDRSTRLCALIRLQSEELEATLAKWGGVPDELAVKRFNHQAGRIVNRLLGYVRPGDDPSSRRAA